MTPSNFSFLEKEFPLLHNLATSAEYHTYSDPVTALIKLSQFGEKLTAFVSLCYLNQALQRISFGRVSNFLKFQIQAVHYRSAINVSYEEFF